MPDTHDQLIAYLATLAALVVVFVAALIAGALQPGILGRIEVYGLGTITGGLIGVLRMPTRPAVAAEKVETVDQRSGQ